MENQKEKMEDAIINSFITPDEVGEIRAKIEAPFRKRIVATEEDPLVEYGSVKVGEEYICNLPHPELPNEAWARLVNHYAKVQFLVLQFGHFQRFKRYKLLAVKEEIKNLDHTIQEALKCSMKEAFDPRLAKNEDRTKQKYWLHEYLRVSQGFYEDHNVFQFCTQPTALTYARYFIWLPHLKSVLQRLEQESSVVDEEEGKNDDNSLISYFKEDKREAAEQIILPFLKEDFKDLKGKNLAAAWFGLYKIGFTDHPQYVNKKQLHSALHNFLQGDNGRYVGFNNDGIAYFVGAENDEKVKKWAKRFKELVNSKN